VPADPWIRKELSGCGEGGIEDCLRARFPHCGGPWILAGRRGPRPFGGYGDTGSGLEQRGAKGECTRLLFLPSWNLVSTP
jgi:hypothetical protein